jgi:hypothetical protein
MTQDEMIDLAKQAGWQYAHGESGFEPLWDFAKLVAAKEREECAKDAGEFAQKWWSIHCHSNKHMETTRKAHDDFCALQSAIRARGEQA